MKKTIKQVYADTLALTEKIRRSGYAPEIVTPFLVGGALPAVVIAKQLGIGSGRFRPVDVGRRGDERYFVLDTIQREAVEGRRVLLVEDDIPSGRGITFVRDMLGERGAGDVRVAALYVKPDTLHHADFHVRVYNTLPDYPYKAFHSGDRI